MQQRQQEAWQNPTPDPQIHGNPFWDLLALGLNHTNTRIGGDLLYLRKIPPNPGPSCTRFKSPPIQVKDLFPLHQTWVKESS